MAGRRKKETQPTIDERFERLFEAIKGHLQLEPTNVGIADDLLQLARNEGAGTVAARRANRVVRAACQRQIANPKNSMDTLQKFHELLGRALFFDAPFDFDAYCQALEWNRPLEERFYSPRRQQLRPMVRGLQDMLEDKIDILSISMPPGVGKTTLGIYFVSMLMGKFPAQSILMSGHSSFLTGGFYLGVMQILVDGDYRWGDIFPFIDIARKNAAEQVIDLQKVSRNPTLMCRSIDGSLTGIARCSKLLYADDLVSGIEEAMSLPRLDSLWSKYANDLRSRKKDRCKELHIATRWSVHDVIGRIERMYQDSDRARFIAIPALDENERSNFDYDFGVGFSTQYFLDMRAIMDEVSWKCLFENAPIEREGLVYAEDELRRYYDLPMNEDGSRKTPDAIIAVADTKEKGKDFYFSPVAYLYGEDYYIEDCVCDDGLVGLDERVAAMYLKHGVQQSRFESNAAGGRAADCVQQIVKTKGGNTHITKKYNTANKMTRMIVFSEWVKRHCLFRDKSLIKPHTDYARMMKQLTSFSQKGKNPFDDVPDGMAQLADFAQTLSSRSLEVVKNPFRFTS